MGVLEDLKKRILVWDGGFGSLLQEAGLKAGELPETWNVKHPEAVTKIHRDYLNAGADIINANTFGANRFKYNGVAEYDLPEIIEGAFNCAKAAVKEAGHGYIALDIGPTGKLLKPMGELAFEDAVETFAEVVREGVKNGADLILIETMSDMYELKAAILAAKENSDLPVFATVVFDKAGKLLTGGTPKAAVALMEGLGVDALGTNCSLGPVQMQPMVKELLRYASVPVIVNPNAGLPRSEGGKTVYDVGPEEFASAMDQILDMGASVVGGCCGTTPEYIRLVKEKADQHKVPVITPKEDTIVTSYAVAQEIGDDPVIVGERINPTGKKRFQQALKEHDMDYILNMGLAQQKQGAHILDVNVGLPGIDETAMMTETVEELQSIIELPLQIDTSDFEAMEAALRIYNGKPMINSVNGKQESMDAVFPLAAKYGGVVVALALDERGIPKTADERVEIAQKIYREAAKYGIPKKDIVIDCLCMTISSEPEGAVTTLETVRRIHEMGGKTILGVSNISFGLPQRVIVNSTFYTMALQAGLNAAIINPNSDAMMRSYYAYRALYAKDEHCGDYIARFSQYTPPLPKGAVWAKDAAQMLVDASMDAAKRIAGGQVKIRARSNSSSSEGGSAVAKDDGNEKKEDSPPEALSPAGGKLLEAVKKGLKEQAKKAAGEALEEEDALQVINRYMIPALDQVGKDFEVGTVFLPQLLMSAEAAKAAFAVIKDAMGSSGAQVEKKGKVILATVKDDIHDIGKNIVKVLLENYSYDVIDLGRDVPPEKIVDATVKEHAPVVGLSALMTTTVANMAETIRQLREKAPWVKICVGGAVMTQEYADQIGADGYCKDAMATVEFAKKVIGK